jgi:hypothetical protein
MGLVRIAQDKEAQPKKADELWRASRFIASVILAGRRAYCEHSCQKHSARASRHAHVRSQAGVLASSRLSRRISHFQDADRYKQRREMIPKVSGECVTGRTWLGAGFVTMEEVLIKVLAFISDVRQSVRELVTTPMRIPLRSSFNMPKTTA